MTLKSQVRELHEKDLQNIETNQNDNRTYDEKKLAVLEFFIERKAKEKIYPGDLVFHLNLTYPEVEKS
ncbi:MAG: hypothetical protein ACXADA_09570 [Candidatus Hodarchaeales archaeon]|jgi:hypothetical protein